jgi:hypothetical protein
MVSSRYSAVVGIQVCIHNARVGPTVTIQLSQNGTTKSKPAARCRKMVQLAVTWVTYRESALLDAGGTPLRSLIPKGVGMYEHLRPDMPMDEQVPLARCGAIYLGSQQGSTSYRPVEQ